MGYLDHTCLSIHTSDDSCWNSPLPNLLKALHHKDKDYSNIWLVLGWPHFLHFSFFFALWLRRKLSRSTIPIIWTQKGQIICAWVVFFLKTRFQLGVSAKRALQILPLGNVCDKMIISMNQKSALLWYIFLTWFLKNALGYRTLTFNISYFLFFSKLWLEVKQKKGHPHKAWSGELHQSVAWELDE